MSTFQSNATQRQALADELAAAAERGADFIEHALRGPDEGGWQGDLTAHYRSPLALVSVGRKELAEATLSRFEDDLLYHFSTFAGRPARELSLEQTRITNFHEFPLYQPAWLALSAWRVGNRHLATAALDYVLSFHDEGAGAPVVAGPGARQVELAQSAITGLSCLAAGREGPAAAIAKTLGAAVEVMLAGDEPELHFRFTPGHPESPIRTTVAGQAHLYSIVPGEPAQFYWVLGLLLSFLDAQARRSGPASDASFAAELAHQVELSLAFLDRCHRDWPHYAPWKLGGAFAGLSSASIPDALRRRAGHELEAIAKNLIALQQDDGSWLWPETGIEPEDAPAEAAADRGPLEVIADITAENVLWIARMAPVLRGAPCPEL